MTKIKAVFFDLDGTLIDSKQDITHSVNDIRRDLNLSPLSEDEVLSCIGQGTKYLLSCVLNQDIVTDDIYNKFIEYYKINTIKYSKLFDGVNELLYELKDYKKVIITNKSYSVACEVVNKFFKNTFDLVYGGDSFPERKPSPYPIKYAMNELGLLPFQVIYLGDSLPDYKACIESDVKCVMATYGYGTSKELFSCKNAEFINTPLEFLDIIEKSDDIFDIE
jgi:phosphoglycolate phosphatase